MQVIIQMFNFSICRSWFMPTLSTVASLMFQLGMFFSSITGVFVCTAHAPMDAFGAGENVWLLDSQEHMEENLNIFDFELSQDPLESGVFKL